MSSELSDRLRQATNLDEFLSEQGDKPKVNWLSALKSEVDRLVGCDINAATQLSTKIDQ